MCRCLRPWRSPTSVPFYSLSLSRSLGWLSQSVSHTLSLLTYTLYLWVYTFRIIRYESWVMTCIFRTHVTWVMFMKVLRSIEWFMSSHLSFKKLIFIWNSESRNSESRLALIQILISINVAQTIHSIIFFHFDRPILKICEAGSRKTPKANQGALSHWFIPL